MKFTDVLEYYKFTVLNPKNLWCVITSLYLFICCCRGGEPNVQLNNENAIIQIPKGDGMGRMVMTARIEQCQCIIIFIIAKIH